VYLIVAGNEDSYLRRARKHRAILMTAHAAGLGLLEVTGLQVHDIDIKHMVVRFNG
jgi:site-specific recombinase XerC